MELAAAVPVSHPGCNVNVEETEPERKGERDHPFNSGVVTLSGPLYSSAAGKGSILASRIASVMFFVVLSFLL